MPIHDWTLAPPGLFHHFHQDWSVELSRTLNRGYLKEGYYALVEQRVDGPEPDVIAVQTTAGKHPPASNVAVLEKPRTALVKRTQSEAGRYARRANRISIRHPLGDVVAIIEIVSPGNKDSRAALRAFVQKAVDFLRNGIHLLIIDLFPPSPRDPQGIHKAIWDEIASDAFDSPPAKQLTAVSYESSEEITAYIEPIAVGDELPNMPLFLAPDDYVMAPLEATYQGTWSVCPAPIRKLLENSAGG